MRQTTATTDVAVARTARRRGNRDGLILVNVLFIVALAATVVLLMISSQALSVDRTIRLREATQAASIARAGELSAVVALRRDGVAAPQSDSFAEPWALIQDKDVSIAGGRFSLDITDDQARFNLNSLASGGLVAEDRLAKILAVAGLRPALGDPIIAYTRLGGLSDIGQLTVIGMTPVEIGAFAQLVTVLPRDTSINLNTADERLLSVLFASPVTGRLLASARQSRGGFLTPQDLKSLNAITPPGTGFTSDFYSVATEVEIGETRQRIISSLARRSGPTAPEVIVYARRRTAAEPEKAPPRL